MQNKCFRPPLSSLALRCCAHALVFINFVFFLLYSLDSLHPLPSVTGLLLCNLVMNVVWWRWALGIGRKEAIF